MSTLNIHLDTGANFRAGFTEAGELAVAAKVREAVPALYLRSYEDLHRVLTPSRLRVIMALAGQGVMSIDELAPGRARCASRASGRDHARRCGGYRPY